MILAFQLRAAERKRVDELLANISRSWDETVRPVRKALAPYQTPEQFKTAFEKAYKERRDRGDIYDWLRLPDFFEDLALLVRRGRLPLKAVNDALGSAIVRRWEQFRLAAITFRRLADQPTAFKEWEWLYNETKTLQHRQALGD